MPESGVQTGPREPARTYRRGRGREEAGHRTRLSQGRLPDAGPGPGRPDRFGAHASTYTYRAKLDGTPDVETFARTLEEVCVGTVEAGHMTKDLAVLIGPDQPWLTTIQFLDKLDEGMRAKMAG